MEHALLAVLLCAGAQSELDAELERRLRPDPVHDMGPAAPGAPAVPEPSAMVAQEVDALLASALQEERDVQRFRESEPPELVLPTAGLWLRPGLMEELQQAVAPGPEQEAWPAAVSGQGPLQEPGTRGGRLLVQGEPLPSYLQEDIEARTQAMSTRAPGAAAGQATREAFQPEMAAAPPQAPRRPRGQDAGAAPALLPPDATISFVGELEDVSTESVWIRDARGGMVELSIEPDTQVFQNGQAVDVLELREGVPVNASYEIAEGKPVATSLIIMEE